VFGAGEHVALLHPAEAVDGRAVELHALVEGVLELGGTDRERLQLTEDIGEPEADEAHAAFFDGSQDVVGLGLHGCHDGTRQHLCRTVEQPVHTPFTSPI